MTSVTPNPEKSWKKWLPTRKWWAMAIMAASSLTTNLISGGLKKELGIALVGFIAQAAMTYLVPNQETPGGDTSKS